MPLPHEFMGEIKIDPLGPAAAEVRKENRDLQGVPFIHSPDYLKKGFEPESFDDEDTATGHVGGFAGKTQLPRRCQFLWLHLTSAVTPSAKLGNARSADIEPDRRALFAELHRSLA